MTDAAKGPLNDIPPDHSIKECACCAWWSSHGVPVWRYEELGEEIERLRKELES